MVAVSLRQGNAKIECKVTWQDDNVAEYNLRASTIHGAKREITASLRKEGLLPVDRWSVVQSDGREVMRHFSRSGAGDRWTFPIVR
jgi:RNA:NAD 2'-phosphotransferase (TPT1/KptA family)